MKRKLKSARTRNVAGTEIDFVRIRETVIKAVFSDDFLADILVLKGGSALRLLHQVGSRSSLDVDFAMPGRFESIDEAKARLQRAIVDRFDSENFVVFDFEFITRGRDDVSGYEVAFKIVRRDEHGRMHGDIAAIRRQSEIIDHAQRRRFRIDILCDEYCDAKEASELDGFVIHVYSPEMILFEKLRALCQQLPGYDGRVHKAPRPRDLYDIYAVATERSIDVISDENCALARAIFAAKNVPVDLIGRLVEAREFHRPHWQSVVDSVSAKESLESYDFYFDFVLMLAKAVEACWVV